MRIFAKYAKYAAIATTKLKGPALPQGEWVFMRGRPAIAKVPHRKGPPSQKGNMRRKE